MEHSKDSLGAPLVTIECGTPREAVGDKKAPSGLAMTGQVPVAAPECGCFGKEDSEEPYPQFQLQSPDAHRHTDPQESMPTPSIQTPVCLSASIKAVLLETTCKLKTFPVPQN